VGRPAEVVALFASLAKGRDVPAHRREVAARDDRRPHDVLVAGQTEAEVAAKRPKKSSGFFVFFVNL